DLVDRGGCREVAAPRTPYKRPTGERGETAPPGARRARRAGHRRGGRGPPATAGTSSGLDERVPQVVVDRLLGNPEGPADPDGRQLTGGHQPVHRHLGHPHDGGDLRHRQELHLAERSFACTHRTPLPHVFQGYPHWCHRSRTSTPVSVSRDFE